MDRQQPPTSPEPPRPSRSATAGPLSAKLVADWCLRRGLAFAVSEDGSQVTLPRSTPDAAPLRVVGWPERGVATFALVVARGLPESQHAAVQAVCARANAHMFCGAWVLNTDLGQLYLRLSVPLKGVTYDDDALQWLVDTALGTADAVLPDLRAALASGEDPGAAAR